MVEVIGVLLVFFHFRAVASVWLPEDFVFVAFFFGKSSIFYAADLCFMD